jgi:acetyl esterase/lipase
VISKTVYTYKAINNCEIKADVYSSTDLVIQPLVIWMHGGALIWGNRESILPEQVKMYVEAGFNLVSIDYRLAPETKLPDIVEDVRDAYHWVRERGSRLFHIDPNRIAIVGHSAGGYLALMTGFCVNPRPSALVSFYGYGDIAGPWYSQPSYFYRQQPLVTGDEACKTVGGQIISSTPTTSDRWLYYLYCRQNGLWPGEVTGHEPDIDSEFFDFYCPVRNVTEEYPPTLLLHGDSDTDVPHEQSVMMASELARAKCAYELITIPEGGHVFDQAGMDDVRIANVFKRVISFLEQYLIGEK